MADRVNPDLISVTNALEIDGALKNVGGPAGVAKFAGMVSTAANVQYWARLVKESAVRLRLWTVATSIASECGDPPSDLDFDGWAASCERRLSDILSERASHDYRPVGECVTEAIEEIEAIIDGSLEYGLSTGFSGFDWKARLVPGELIILAGRPGTGKSALALNIAAHLAMNCNKRVAFASLEMSRSELMKRLLCQVAEVSANVIQPGGIPKDDPRGFWAKLVGAVSRIAPAPMMIDDISALTVGALRARARRLKREGGLDLIIIDYLQLMSGNRQRGDNREREIADLSRNLKGLARELGIPVMALCQLNRAPESREDGRVRLSDLRESGAIEQDADKVLALYCPWFASPNKYYDNYVRFETLKDRNGPAGYYVELLFQKEITRFVAWPGITGGQREKGADSKLPWEGG